MRNYWYEVLEGVDCSSNHYCDFSVDSNYSGGIMSIRQVESLAKQLARLLLRETNEPPTGGVIAEGVGCHVNNAVRFGKLPCGG